MTEKDKLSFIIVEKGKKITGTIVGVSDKGIEVHWSDGEITHEIDFKNVIKDL